MNDTIDVSIHTDDHDAVSVRVREPAASFGNAITSCSDVARLVMVRVTELVATGGYEVPLTHSTLNVRLLSSHRNFWTKGAVGRLSTATADDVTAAERTPSESTAVTRALKDPVAAGAVRAIEVADVVVAAVHTLTLSQSWAS